MSSGNAPGQGAYERFRNFTWKYVGTLVLEREPSGEYVMSLGRFFTALMMLYAMYLWADESRPDLPDSMRQTLWILLGYNLGTKGIRVAESRKLVKEEPVEKPQVGF